MLTRVVLCGSFHRDASALHLLFKELEATGCRVLSPLSIEFLDPTAKFVKSDSELTATSKELESFHLRAIREADLIFLHAPDGYVGLSTAFEIGYAEALSKPVFSKHELKEVVVNQRIVKVISVFEALEQLNTA